MPLNMRGAKMMASLTWMTYPAKFWLELGGGRPTMKLLSVAVVVSLGGHHDIIVSPFVARSKSEVP